MTGPVHICDVEDSEFRGAIFYYTEDDEGWRIGEIDSIIRNLSFCPYCGEKLEIPDDRP